jgi:hypothetical protein
MPRAGMAQRLAPNFLFKHDRRQSTKSRYRPVGLEARRNTQSSVDLANHGLSTTCCRQGLSFDLPSLPLADDESLQEFQLFLLQVANLLEYRRRRVVLITSP